MDHPVTHHSGKIRRGTWYIATQGFPALHGVRGIVPGWTSYVRICPQLEMGNAPMLLHDSCRDWSNHHVTVTPSNNTRVPYGCKLCDWMGRGDSVFLNECDTVANNFRLCSQKSPGSDFWRMQLCVLSHRCYWSANRRYRFTFLIYNCFSADVRVMYMCVCEVC